MVEFMKSRFSDGSVDNIVFQPQATGGPSGGETIIRLPDDVIIDNLRRYVIAPRRCQFAQRLSVYFETEGDLSPT